MVELNLPELERIAREATAGPWWRVHSAVRAPSQGDYGVAYDCHARDAAFIAAFNPSVALALLAEISRLQSELEGVKRNLKLAAENCVLSMRATSAAESRALSAEQELEKMRSLKGAEEAAP